MPKTKEQISAYNREYFARPEVIARAKVRNAQRRDKRKAYKQTEAGKEADRRYRRTERSKELQNIIRLKTRYGITPEQYAQLVVQQKACCAICGGAFPGLHIDHDHATGAVRGLLCGSCNRGLGMFKDDAVKLRQAAKYLERGI